MIYINKNINLDIEILHLKENLFELINNLKIIESPWRLKNSVLTKITKSITFLIKFEFNLKVIKLRLNS